MGALYSCFKSDDLSKSQNKEQSKAKEVDQRDITVLKLKAVQDKLLAQKKAIQRNADKAMEEAKQHIANKNKERAMFSLKRKKLYETYLTDTENQYAIVQKSIIDVESAIMTSQYIEVLKETNDLIKEIESAGHLEKLQEIGDDIKEREQKTREFNKLFEEHHIDDVEDMFNQYEREVQDEDELNAKPVKKVVQQQQPVNNNVHVENNVREENREEEQEDKEISDKLLALA